MSEVFLVTHMAEPTITLEDWADVHNIRLVVTMTERSSRYISEDGDMPWMVTEPKFPFPHVLGMGKTADGALRSLARQIRGATLGQHGSDKAHLVVPENLV